MIEGEENLIKQAQKGEIACFGQLYDYYLPKIYRFVLLKVSQRQVAEDLTHDTFLSAWQSLGKYASQGFPFSSWLYHIARNKIIDHYRTRRTHGSLEKIDESLFKVAGVVENNLDQLLDFERARKAISKLSADQQDVLIMRYVEDFSYQEIAAALNKSEGAVRLLQHRGINNLKNLLSDPNLQITSESTNKE